MQASVQTSTSQSRMNLLQRRSPLPNPRKHQPKHRQRRHLLNEERKPLLWVPFQPLTLTSQLIIGFSQSESDDEVIEIEDDDDDEEEAPKPTKRTNRAAVLRFVVKSCRPVRHANIVRVISQPAKKAPAKKKAAAAPAKQSQLAFAPAGRSSRAAATKARGKMVVSPLQIIILLFLTTLV